MPYKCIFNSYFTQQNFILKFSYTAISPSSESTFIPLDILEQLKRRFKRIIILFDRDIAGVKNSRKLSLKHGLNAMFVHKKFNAKDISDAVKLNGFDKVKNWLYKEMSKCYLKNQRTIFQEK